MISTQELASPTHALAPSPPDPTVRELGAMLTRAHHLTRDAALALGMSESDAEQAARDGGLVIGGMPMVLAPLPLEGSETGALLITVSLELPLEALTPETLGALLAQAPGLLAAHRSALGCGPEGTLQLHRLVATRPTAASVAQDLVETRQLAEWLLRCAASDPGAVS